MSRYVVREKEAGNIIATVRNMEEGNKLIKEYESCDKADGSYSEDFYEVVEIED